MTTTKDRMELDCTFSTVKTNFLTHLWNLWITNPFVDLPHLTLQNYFLSCYTIMLIQGKTISGTIVKSSIVKNYIKAACNLFTDKRLPLSHSCKTNFINIIVHTLHHYKTVPRKRNMITNKMTLWMTKHTPPCPKHIHLLPSLTGLSLANIPDFGFCALEWGQTLQNTYNRIIS